MDLDKGTIMEGKYFYTCNNQVLMNVLHYELSDVLPGVDPLAVTTAFLTFFSSNAAGTVIEDILGMQGNNVSWLKVSAQIIHPTRFKVRELVTPYVGLSPITCTAQNLQAAVLKRGLFGSRHDVGELHIGGLASDQYSNGIMSLSGYASLNQIATKLLTPISAGGLPGVVWDLSILNKRKIPNSNPPRFEITGATEVFELVALQPLRVMNRRTVGRGI